MASTPISECGVIKSNRLTALKHLLPPHGALKIIHIDVQASALALKRNATARLSKKMLPSSIHQLHTKK